MKKTSLDNANNKGSPSTVELFNLVDSKQALVVRDNMLGNLPSSSSQPQWRIGDYTKQDTKEKGKFTEIDFFSNEKKKNPRLAPTDPQLASKQVIALQVPNIKEDDITFQIGLECVECWEEHRSLPKEQIEEIINELKAIKQENNMLREENTKLKHEEHENSKLGLVYPSLQHEYYRLVNAYNELKSDYKYTTMRMMHIQRHHKT